MGMLNQEDLKQIGELMDGKFGELVEDVLIPKFDEMDARFEKIDARFEKIGARFEKIDARFEKLETSVATLPDKNFVTDQIGKLEGQMNLRFREQGEKFDDLIDTLQSKEVLTFSETARLKTPKIMPGPAS